MFTTSTSQRRGRLPRLVGMPIIGMAIIAILTLMTGTTAYASTTAMRPHAAATVLGSSTIPALPAGAVVVPLHFVPNSSTTGPSPNNTVGGNCGYSYIYGTRSGSNHFAFSFGFYGLCFPANYYHWADQFYTANSTFTRSGSGGLFFRTAWNGSTAFYAAGPVSAFADIEACGVGGCATSNGPSTTVP